MDDFSQHCVLIFNIRNHLLFYLIQSVVGSEPNKSLQIIQSLFEFSLAFFLPDQVNLFVLVLNFYFCLKGCFDQASDPNSDWDLYSGPAYGWR